MSTPKKPNDGAEKKPSWLESLFGSSKERKAVTERVRTASIFHALTPRFLQKKNNDNKPSTPSLAPAKTPEQEKKDKKHFLATLFTPRAHKNNPSLSASNPNLSKLLKKVEKDDQTATPSSPVSTTTPTTSNNNSPALLITVPSSPSTVSSPVLIPMDTPKKTNDPTVRKSRSFHQGGFNSLPTTPQFSFRPTQQSSLEESEIKLLAAKAKNRLSTSPNTVAQLQMQAILVDRFAKKDNDTMLMVIGDADEQSSNSTGTNSNPSSLTHSVANDHLTSYAAGSILKDALMSQELASTTTTTTISPDAEEDDDDLEEDKTAVVIEENTDTEEDLYAKAQLIVDKENKNVPQATYSEDNSNEPLYLRIHRASGEGNYKLLSKLIQTDDKVEENINMIDPSDQSTPLHKAASRNRHEVMKLLLTKGAGINSKDQFASTPLHWACANANIECIHVLCNYGAEINVRDRYGYAPIHLALKKKCFRGAEILVLYGGDINLKKSDGTTVLHQACESGDMDLVKWLLGKEKVLINCKDKRGETPLLRAATHGRIKVVEHLLNTANVQINLADDKKQTMLHRSAMYGFRDLLLMVAFHDPNICNAMLNEQDIEGRTPLHYAVIKNHFREVKTLTTMGADLNFQDRHGNTPLMIALKNNMPKIARFLYKVGANSDVKNKKNETAKSMLKSNNLLK